MRWWRKLEQEKGKRTWEVESGDKWREVRKKETRGQSQPWQCSHILAQPPLFISSLNPASNGRSNLCLKLITDSVGEQLADCLPRFYQVMLKMDDSTFSMFFTSTGLYCTVVGTRLEIGPGCSSARQKKKFIFFFFSWHSHVGIFKILP